MIIEILRFDLEFMYTLQVHTDSHYRIARRLGEPAARASATAGILPLTPWRVYPHSSSILQSALDTRPARNAVR